jgi:enoyl-CoA hydratase/carnithine racemase
MQLDKTGDVFVLTLDEDDNRFNPAWVHAFVGFLDQVEAQPGPRALVTAGVGKFWSNGLDLAWIIAHPHETPALMTAVHEMFARVVSAPFPTVVALQGHAFAAGAMLALAHDIRIMREDRGFVCLPEVDIKIPFTPGMNALVRSRLSPQVAHLAMNFGMRFGGAEARDRGIVDETTTEALVLPRAIERAAGLAEKDAKTLGAIKSMLYADVLATLRDTEANTVAEFPKVAS